MSGSRHNQGELFFDICDGDLFENESYEDPILHIIAYYDEFTMTNPLMSRAKKYKIGIIIISHSRYSPFILF